MCREEASELASIRPAITACGVRMVAIVKEALGAPAFAEKFWRSDEIFLDEGLGFYKAVFGGKLGKFGLSNLLGKGIYSNYLRATSKGYSGDYVGEGRVLGGLYIVSMRGIHYEYPERTSGDHPPVDEVIKVVKSLAPPSVDLNTLDFKYARTAATAASRPAGALGIGAKPKTLEDARAQGQRMLERLKQRQAAGAGSSAPATLASSSVASLAAQSTSQEGQCVDCEPTTDMEIDK